MAFPFPILEPGTRVRTFTGYTGTIFRPAKRAYADIRVAVAERDRDMQPYTVSMDRGGFSTYRGQPKWLETVTLQLEQSFPLDIGNHERLYVWEAEDA